MNNQLIEIVPSEVDHVSPDHVQPSYMSNDSDAIEERRYRNAQEMLQVAINAMHDVDLTRSHRQARKQSDKKPPPPASTSGEKDSECVDEGCRDAHFESLKSHAPASYISREKDDDLWC